MAVIMGSVAVILLIVCLSLVSGGGGGLFKFNESDNDLDLTPNKLISLCCSLISGFTCLIMVLGGVFISFKKYM